jgi:asparagine synthase (glutamine-hydrolysing)
MCGIVGIVGGSPQRHEVQAMLASVRHRGPDGEGVHVAPGIALGNVRLAIVDPTPAGAQPMASPDGRYTLVYNGEIYNHKDFRAALEASGVQFRGHSDTETLLWLLIRHGSAILPKLNGIFGFAFHDALSGKVLIARDHVGVKPLYYARGRDGRLLFASEIKALFVTGDVQPRINHDDLLELFMFHFIAGERTAFRDVSELLPGHLMEVIDGHARIREFWSPLTAATRGDAPDESAEQLRVRLEAAVQRQLMSDVPLGVMSSGGVDSGLVSAFARREGARLQGFCYRDSARGYDELADAREIGALLGIDIHEVGIPEADVPELLHTLTWHYDEPIPRTHYLAAFAVSRAARENGIKVLLAGEGGDELFGGYQRYSDLAAEMERTNDESPLVFAHNRVAIPRVRHFLSQQRFANAFRFWCAEETRGLDLVNRELLVDQRTFLQHFMQRSDRMGLAAGVEIRVPLLDLELVEHINAQPGSRKVANGATKIALRQVARSVLTPAIVDRPKKGFDMPMLELLRRGPVSALIDDLLLGTSHVAALLDTTGIPAFVQEFRAGNDELWKVLWMLLSTELWARRFKVTA